jgi:hypothetical protein
VGQAHFASPRAAIHDQRAPNAHLSDLGWVISALSTKSATPARGPRWDDAIAGPRHCRVATPFVLCGAERLGQSAGPQIRVRPVAQLVTAAPSASPLT